MKNLTKMGRTVSQIIGLLLGSGFMTPIEHALRNYPNFPGAIAAA